MNPIHRIDWQNGSFGLITLTQNATVNKWLLTINNLELLSVGLKIPITNFIRVTSIFYFYFILFLFLFINYLYNVVIHLTLLRKNCLSNIEITFQS